MQIPDVFQHSYEVFETYPRNICNHSAYPGILQAYANRLDGAASRLLTESEAEVSVPFRDFVSASQDPDTHNIYGDDALKKWLGDQSSIDPNTSQCNGMIATKTDPKCRFIFLTGGNSRKPLKISRRMLTRILTYHQVMPSYLDFMFVFGLSNSARELRFSGFRQQTSLPDRARNPAIPGMGRSGSSFQMCYNLKGVARIVPTNPAQWSIQQAAIHHQFDIEEGTALWIVTKGDLEIKDRVKALTGKGGRPEDRAFESPAECLKSSLAVHLLLCHWSIEEWRWYIQHLEDAIEAETDTAIHGHRGRGEAARVYVPSDLQTLQDYQDKVNQTIMVLEANNDVLASLRSFYHALPDSSAFTLKDACSSDITSFTKQVDEMIHDSSMQVSRTKLLIRITSDRKDLVVQHLQTQTTQKMEDLTTSMHGIGVGSQKEAIIMRIITAVTLVYLPGTFVSTLFSTDVIRFPENRETFSPTALFRWLQVTFPLTILTLIVAFIVFRLADKRRKHALSTFQDAEMAAVQPPADQHIFLKGS
ncbi:hypothetical protein XANCAGTX0491_009506 [Xanthoria calcicola]